MKHMYRIITSNHQYDFILDRNEYGTHSYVCDVDNDDFIYGNVQCFDKLKEILEDIPLDEQNSEEFCSFWADIFHRVDNTKQWYLEHEEGKYLKLQRDRRRLLSRTLKWRHARAGNVYSQLCNRGVITCGCYL